MTSDDPLEEPIDPGVWGTIDPMEDEIVFREETLSRARVDAVRPFDQAKSDKGDQPIRVVVRQQTEKHIMQGNHRAFGAQEDGVRDVRALVYSPEEWEAFTGIPFRPRGTNNPEIRS
jgi:hypothetical protein